MGFLYLLIRPKFEKVWKFDYLVIFARINFREFVLAKNSGIYFRKIAKNSRNSRKLLLLRDSFIAFRYFIRFYNDCKLGIRTKKLGISTFTCIFNVYFMLNLLSFRLLTLAHNY